MRSKVFSLAQGGCLGSCGLQPAVLQPVELAALAAEVTYPVLQSCRCWVVDGEAEIEQEPAQEATMLAKKD